MGQTSVVNTALANGIPGEFYSTEPQGARSLILNSTNATLNVIGSVVTYVDDENEQAGIAASTRFAGIIGMPKTLVQRTLEPAIFISNGTIVEVLNKGYVFVNLPGAAAKGDFVYYSDTDGTLTTVAPDAAPPVGYTRVPGGRVEIMNVSEAGLGVIYIDLGGDISDSTGV